jgi:hypothetical protein
MAETRHTVAEVITAIDDSSGIKMDIARRLKVHRNTVENYLNRYPTARAAYNREVETVGDIAESVIIKAIRNDDIETSKWYLRMKAKDRGYTERHEITGKNGADVGVVVKAFDYRTAIAPVAAGPDDDGDAPG